MKNLLTLLTILLLFSGCNRYVTYPRCYQKFGGMTDTVRLSVPYYFKVNADSSGIDVDSNTIANLPINAFLRTTPEATKVFGELKRKDKNTYRLSGKCPERIIYDTIQAICPPAKILKPPPPEIIYRVPKWYWYLLAVMAAASATLFVVVLIKR
jgi:hypothetical protein